MSLPALAARHQLPRDVPGEDWGEGGSEQITHCRKEQPQPAGTMHSSPHTLPAQMEQQDSPADCTQGQEITSREKWQAAGQAKCCLPARRG